MSSRANSATTCVDTRKLTAPSPAPVDMSSKSPTSPTAPKPSPASSSRRGLNYRRSRDWASKLISGMISLNVDLFLHRPPHTHQRACVDAWLPGADGCPSLGHAHPHRRRADRCRLRRGVDDCLRLVAA